MTLDSVITATRGCTWYPPPDPENPAPERCGNIRIGLILRIWDRFVLESQPEFSKTRYSDEWILRFRGVMGGGSRPGLEGRFEKSFQHDFSPKENPARRGPGPAGLARGRAGIFFGLGQKIIRPKENHQAENKHGRLKGPEHGFLGPPASRSATDLVFVPKK